MTHQAAPILVTGATGNTGRAIVDALVERGAPVRAMVRSEAGRGKLRPEVEGVVADFDDSAAIAVALDGAERAYLVTPSSEQAEELTFRRKHSARASRDCYRRGRWTACSRITHTTDAAKQQRYRQLSRRSLARRLIISTSSLATTPLPSLESTDVDHAYTDGAHAMPVPAEVAIHSVATVESRPVAHFLALLTPRRRRGADHDPEPRAARPNGTRASGRDDSACQPHRFA